MRSRTLALWGLLLAPAAALAGDARAAADDAASPTAIRRPAVITRPGVYLVTDDFALGGAEVAIEIRASNVTVDLGGHTLIGPGGRRGRGIAILGASNVRVHNGHLRRLGVGVLAEEATNLVLENLQIDGLDSGGAPPDVEIGILLVSTRGARVAHNLITDTFLGIFVRGEGSGGNRIAENTLTGAAQGELGICYNPAPGEQGGGPHGDLVYQNLVSRFRLGMQFSEDSTGNVVRENTVAFFDSGITEQTPGSNLIEENDEVAIAR